MANFEDSNLGKMLKRLKLYYKTYPEKIHMQVGIIFLITTFICGQAGQSLSILSNGIGHTSWNPFSLFFYAWIKHFMLTLLLNVIFNGIILYMKINMEDPLYDNKRNFTVSDKGTLGTGGFMKTNEKVEKLIMDNIENIDGNILGKDPETKLICSPKSSLYLNSHKVVCGGSGARKTTTQVMNDLFQDIKRGESFIVTDPKGEIYEMLSVLVEKRGYTTRVLNLVNLENSDGVDFVKACRDPNGKQSKEIENVQTLAKVIIANTTEDVTGGFWDDNQKGLLTAAILYVMYDQTGQTEPTLAGAYELLLKKRKEDIDRLFNNLDNNHPSKAQYLLYAKTEAKVRDSVINGLLMRLQILQTDTAQRIVSEDEIDLTLPSKKKCAYFLIISDQTSTFDFISSLFFSMFFIKDVQYIDSLKKQVRESSALIPVNLMMDEFPSIGTLVNFDRKLATLRSRRINITIIFQNYGQIIDKYDKNQWETIVANCDTNIYLGGNDSEKTAEYYNNRLGGMTVVTKGKRLQEKLLSVTDNKFHPSYTTTEGETQRDVMTKDELLRLDIDHAIVFLKSCRPLDVLKMVYKEHPMSEEIIERNPSIHIPDWRRRVEGYPDLTDTELESTVELLTDTGKIREYLNWHERNQKYCFMDYLAEQFPEEYKKLDALLKEKEGNPPEAENGSEVEEQEEPVEESIPGNKEAGIDSNSNPPSLNTQSSNAGQVSDIPGSISYKGMPNKELPPENSQNANETNDLLFANAPKLKNKNVDTPAAPAANGSVNTGVENGNNVGANGSGNLPPIPPAYTGNARIPPMNANTTQAAQSTRSQEDKGALTVKEKSKNVKSFGIRKGDYGHSPSRFRSVSKNAMLEDEEKELKEIQRRSQKMLDNEAKRQMADKKETAEKESTNNVIHNERENTKETVEEGTTPAAMPNTSVPPATPPVSESSASDIPPHVTESVSEPVPPEANSKVDTSSSASASNTEIISEDNDSPDFEDFDADANAVVLPEADGKEVEDEPLEMSGASIMDSIPTDLTDAMEADGGKLDDEPFQQEFDGSIKNESDSFDTSEGEALTEEYHEPEAEFPEEQFPGKQGGYAYTEPVNTIPAYQDTDSMESTLPKEAAADLKEPESSNAGKSSSEPGPVEASIPENKEYTPADFTMFADTGDSSGASAETSGKKRMADRRKKGFSKMSQSAIKDF